MKNFILGCLLLLCGISYGQQITGKVTDDTGMPVPDVYITVANSTVTASADIDGNFTITANEGDLLTFSMLGFDNATVAATTTPMAVTLKPSTSSILNEVVVVGYGTAKRSELTFAVGTVKSEQFQKQPAFNAMQSIQGKVAGVQIINNDAPGATPTVRIRGLGTASAGSDPLYVVDGVVTGSIANISPSDIETMDILKDASSAAIYGQGAANGVVLITTKKGKSGKMNVSVSSSYAAKSILNQVKMANSSQYIQYYNENQATLGGGGTPISTNQPYNTDWFDEVAQVGHTQMNNVQVSGGTDKTSYLFSYNNYSEEGLLKNQDLSRNTLRSNTTFRLFDDRLKITDNINYTFTKRNPKPFGAFDEAYRQAPIVPAYYPNGAFGQSFYNQTTGVVGYQAGPGESIGRLNSIGNPLSTVYYANEETKMNEIQALVDAEFKITDWLKIESRVGLNKSFAKTRIYNDIRGQYLSADPTRTGEQFDADQLANPTSTTYANNSLSYADTESFRYNWDTFLTFNKTFDKHAITVVGGITKDKRNDVYSSSILDYNVPTKQQYWNINNATGAYDAIVSQYYTTPIQLLSYFGRLQYAYENKYYVTGNFRRDGNSTFKESGKFWGNFPSVSVGWNLTGENFLSDVKGVDFFKIRGGYGELGNANVPFNATTLNTSSASSSANYVFGPNQDLIYGAYVGSPALPISWEVTKEVSAGVDFEFLNRRLTGNADYYHRTTTNAILNVTPTLDSPNTTNFYDHGAEVSNKGFEVALNWSDAIGQDFTYFVGGTFTHNKNTLENVKPAYDGNTGGSLANGQITKRLQAGQPIYAWWMYEADGVWQNQAEIDDSAHLSGAQPGQLKYKDQNGDGVIDDSDKKFFGSYLPTFNYGISIGFNWKNLDFSADGFGVGGNKIYNGLKGTRIDGGENITADTYNGRWTAANPNNSNPGANRTATASSYYLEKGDYFRINNITVGYSFKDVLKNVSKIRLYATAQNPLMLTKYSGFTPELLGSGRANETAGIELSAYPTTKTFVFGVQIEL
jgi:TonB-dependent starch-binding outer membrane protein SusC